MRGPDIQFRCRSCGQLSPRTALVSTSWGDSACPACKSPNLERYHSKADTFYAMLFTFRVF